MTGDVGDMYNDFRKLKQARHNEVAESNTKILQDCGFPIIVYATTIHVKAPHTYVLFYPHTGRWQVKGFRNMHSGGARKCVDWLRNIEGKEALRLENLR
jgi:hypothetical protein